MLISETDWNKPVKTVNVHNWTFEVLTDIEAVEAGSENNQDQELESDDLGMQQYCLSI